MWLSKASQPATSDMAKLIYYKGKKKKKKGIITISGLLEVDVGIAERSSGYHVSANPDGENGASR